MVNDQEVQAIVRRLRELEERATKGPWFATCTDHSTREGSLAAKYGDDVYSVSTSIDEAGWETDGGCSGYGISLQNAELIAYMRNNIIKLLDALDDYSLRP